MQTTIHTITSFAPGQRVRTGFGEGVVSAISLIDSIVYVALARDGTGLYLFRPEQVEAILEGGH